MKDYIIKRSSRKTLAIEVKADKTVLIRAPFSASDEEIQAIIQEKSDWIEAAIKKQAERPICRELTDKEKAELRSAAEEYIPERVKHYATAMSLEPQSVKITSAKTRFGSCSSKNRLCFSLYLMLYPPQAVDYVIVHELAHIVHKNHSKQFYRLIEKYMPDYKKRIRLLK